jgi:hypothetical protein
VTHSFSSCPRATPSFQSPNSLLGSVGSAPSAITITSRRSFIQCLASALGPAKEAAPSGFCKTHGEKLFLLVYTLAIHPLQPSTLLPAINLLQSLQTFALVATCIHRVLGIVCLSTLHPQLHTSLPSHEGPSLQITAVIVNKMSSFASTGSPKLGRKASSKFDVLAHNEDRELPTTNEAAVRLNTPNRQARRATRYDGY